MTSAMTGIYTALITPFDDRLEVDLPAFRRLLGEQRAAGVAGVIPCGTTGESPTLSLEEKKSLIQTALTELRGSGVQVLAGTGSNNTRETVEFSRWASDQGVAGVLLVTPYYNKPSQAGLEAHFRAVADAVACEVMLYNVPGRTGVSLEPETVVALAAHSRIRSIKEASGNPATASAILDGLAERGRSLNVLAGDDATYLALLAIGAVGIVSVAANLIPREMVALQQAFDAGDLNAARRLHQRLFPVFRDLFVESNPGPLKYAMGNLALRPPLAAVSPSSAAKIDAALLRSGVPRRPSK